MATWDDVRREALALPQTRKAPHGQIAWFVKDKLFVWERPLRKPDLEALARARRVRSWACAWSTTAQRAMLAENPRVYFTIPT
jgi:hypothetical protein